MLLGAEVTVATHQGKALLTIPPRTPPGQTICIPHMGKRYGHHKGDHWVTLSITLPHSLTEEQQALIRLWQRR
jgi:DnaJ-class molecular chaperone